MWTLTGATTEYTVEQSGRFLELVAWGPHGVGDGPSWEESLCHAMWEKGGPRVAPDVSRVPQYATNKAARGLSVASYVVSLLRPEIIREDEKRGRACRSDLFAKPVLSGGKIIKSKNSSFAIFTYEQDIRFRWRKRKLLLIDAVLHKNSCAVLPVIRRCVECGLHRDEISCAVGGDNEIVFDRSG